MRQTVLTWALVLLYLTSFGLACAPAMPSFSGSRTVPLNRMDVAMGGATRLRVAGPRAAGNHPLLTAAAPLGSTPFAIVRASLTREIDLGLTASPWTIRPAVRWAVTLSEQPLRRDSVHSYFILGVAPYAGLLAVSDEDRDTQQGSRYGVEVPLVFGFDGAGIYELWAGLRFAGEYMHGQTRLPDAEPSADLRMWVGRAGAVVGTAVGFRHLHGMLELTVFYERWSDGGAGQSGQDGLVLMPSFALRFRN